MRILGFDELPSGVEGQVQLLDMSAGWGPMDFHRVREARRAGYPAADYFGVYAVEDGEVLSMIRVLRLPFTTPKGVVRIAGIQGVVTRRDEGRKGLARELMQEVHKREEAAGCEFSLLWTGRGQVAHAFYESLGYADVYSPELATLNCAGVRSRPKGYALKEARNVDVGLMEKLHGDATRHLVGFTPRPPGLVASLLELGFLNRESLRLILHGEEPVGYALFQKNPAWSRLDEVVVLPGTDVRQVLSLFESETEGGWLAIRNTIVRKSLKVLRKRGYNITRFAYYGLLAKALTGPAASGRALGTEGRSFTCQQLDYF